MTEPSTAELVRRIEDLFRSVERLASTLEANYVRKDTHESSVRAVEAMHVAGIRLVETKMESDRAEAARATAEVAQDVKEIRADRERDVAWKRQVTAVLIGSLIGLVGTAGATVFSILAGG